MLSCYHIALCVLNLWPVLTQNHSFLHTFKTSCKWSLAYSGYPPLLPCLILYISVHPGFLISPNTKSSDPSGVSNSSSFDTCIKPFQFGAQLLTYYPESVAEQQRKGGVLLYSTARHSDTDVLTWSFEASGTAWSWAAGEEGVSLLQLPFYLSLRHSPRPVNSLQEKNHQDLSAPPASTHLEQKSWGHVRSFRWSASFHSAIDSSRESFHNNSRQRALGGSSQGRKKATEIRESKTAAPSPPWRIHIPTLPMAAVGFPSTQVSDKNTTKDSRGSSDKAGEVTTVFLRLRLQKGREDLMFFWDHNAQNFPFIAVMTVLTEPSWNRQLKCDSQVAMR